MDLLVEDGKENSEWEGDGGYILIAGAGAGEESCDDWMGFVWIYN
jgi:hypothetical protein